MLSTAKKTIFTIFVAALCDVFGDTYLHFPFDKIDEFSFFYSVSISQAKHNDINAWLLTVVFVWSVR